MLKYTTGNLLNADVEALVNTVNCVGVMGKGIALQFKRAFPENFGAYRRACDAGEVRPGRMHVFETTSLANPRLVINFPTKRHWRGNSRLEDIESGLKALVAVIRERGIRSIGIPPLGCGLGGLDWRVVRPMIEEAMKEVPETEVFLFEPAGAPAADQMSVGTTRPQLTVARALFLQLMEEYQRFNYRLTLLEIQKLAYFLQEAGEPLRLRYEKGHYGPYAQNLNKVLEALEGHFTRGYGDNQKPDVQIRLISDAAGQSKDFLLNHPESLGRLERVLYLIDGFETPHGMELLSSVHWVCAKEEPPAGTLGQALHMIHQWNDRKRRMFEAGHIETAWKRLAEDGFVISGGLGPVATLPGVST